jgi:hypothetical protein
MLNLLNGESPGYFGFQFYLDYMVTWVTTQGSVSTHTHTWVPVFVCCANQRIFSCFCSGI